MDTLQASMASLDWIIVIGYMVGIILLGLVASRGQTDAKDYFLASRSATWPTIGLALIGSNISATTLIGLAGAAYTIGISVFNRGGHDRGYGSVKRGVVESGLKSEGRPRCCEDFGVCCVCWRRLAAVLRSLSTLASRR
jgi:hypothetical protein